MRDAVIVAATRTAVGKAPGGALRTVRPDEMAAAVIGEVLRRVPSLKPADVDDATARHFAFAIPMDEATHAELATIRLSGGSSAPARLQASRAPDGIAASVNAIAATSRGGGTVNVRWDGQAARMALVRDRRTGQVLSFARGGSVDVRARSGDLEVILSDGVRSVARQVKVGAR